MSLAKPYRSFLGIQLALAVGLAMVTFLMFHNERELRRSQQIHIKSYLLADELRQSSDDLTRMARTYVLTGDEAYERRYWTILDIRNGKLPRPVDYNRIYWDLVTNDDPKPRPDGPAESLLSIMMNTGFTEAELAKLTSAQRYSDALVQTERTAMNAVKGLFDDGTGHDTVRRAPDPELARRLMYDEAYHRNKTSIMKPIDEFYDMFETRTAGEVAKYERRSRYLIESLAALILVIMGVFATLLVIIARQNREARQSSLAVETERRLSDAIIQGMPGIVCLIDSRSRFLRWNANLQTATGYTAGELSRMSPLEFFGAEEVPLVAQRIQQVFTHGASDIEASLVAKGGGRTPYYFTGLRCQLNDETCLIACGIDITALKRGEDAVRESEQLLRDSQSIAGLGSYVLDIREGIWRSSEVLDSIFGIDESYDRTAVIGWANLLHPDDRADMAAYFADEVVGRGRPFDREYRIVRVADGVERRVHGLGRLEFDTEGRPVKMLGTIQDITDRTEAELERAKLESQLVHAQKMESIGRLAGGVAHDFNNFLQGMMGYLEFCRDDLEPGHPVHAHIDEIADSARRSADLVRQLLAFARKQNIAPAVLDPNQTLSGMLRMLRHLVGRDVDVSWRPGVDIGTVRMDPSQFDQVMANLAVNARDAMNGSGTFTMRTGCVTIDEAFCADHEDSSPGTYTIITASDDGCGMDSETLAHVFEPFFTTKPVGAGTGLGLATVYGIVKQNRGFITVESAPKAGTTFTIHLPRLAASAPAAMVADTAAPRADGHETILLVEDEPAVNRAVRKILERSGYTVLAAATPEDAKRLVVGHPGEIHLLLTDIVMPGMNGRDLAAHLRTLRPLMKRIFMSGYADVEVGGEFAPDETLDFLPKPFTRDSLVGKVREVLDRDTDAHPTNAGLRGPF
jgi:PAS domain S-box-containing protein